jgi:hypothetical protein
MVQIHGRVELSSFASVLFKTFIYSANQQLAYLLFPKYFLSAYFGEGTVLGGGDKSVNWKDMVSDLLSAESGRGDRH